MAWQHVIPGNTSCSGLATRNTRQHILIGPGNTQYQATHLVRVWQHAIPGNTSCCGLLSPLLTFLLPSAARRPAPLVPWLVQTVPTSLPQGAHFALLSPVLTAFTACMSAAWVSVHNRTVQRPDCGCQTGPGWPPAHCAAPAHRSVPCPVHCPVQQYLNDHIRQEHSCLWQ